MLFAFLCFKQLAHIPLDLLWVGAFLNDGERGQRKPCNLSFLESDDFIQPLNLGTISIASRCFGAMPELSVAEKFLADWTTAYTAADRPDRLAADTSGESCLADAELAGILKEDVVKAADGDLTAYLGNALKAKRILQSPSV